MSELDDLARRVSALEERVGAEATARASMDEDLRIIQRKLDMHSGLIAALRDSQIDHGHRLDRLTESVDYIRTEHGARLQDIVGLLNTLIERDNN